MYLHISYTVNVYFVICSGRSLHSRKKKRIVSSCMVSRFFSFPATFAEAVDGWPQALWEKARGSNHAPETFILGKAIGTNSEEEQGARG